MNLTDVAGHFTTLTRNVNTAGLPQQMFIAFPSFDGQVIEFAGRRDGEKTYVSVSARRDAALAAQFPAPAPPTPTTPAVTPATGAGQETSPATTDVEDLARAGREMTRVTMGLSRLPVGS